MPQVTVIAHFMHEDEAAAAQQALENPVQTGSYSMGIIDDAQIPALEAQGVIVEVMESEPLDLGDQPLRRAGATRGGVTLPYDSTGPDYYRVWFQGPLLESRHQDLQRINAELRERLGDGSFILHMTPESAEAVSALPYVRGLQLYGYTAPASASRSSRGGRRDSPRSGRRGEPAAQPSATAETRRFDVRLHREEDRAQIEQWLRGQGVSILGSGRRKIRVELAADAELLAQMRGMAPIDGVDEYVPPKLYNNRARVLLGIEEEGVGAHRLAQTGNGQIVAVADTGIDDSHPDLKKRIAGVAAWGRLNDASDPDGHGTHVAGSVAGDGSASNHSVCGTAPGAQLYFQSVMDKYGLLTGLPIDIYELFEDAYAVGARIHNNSWGAKTASRYVANSLELDEFVADKRDMLIVVAAGNEGTAASPVNARKGYVDWLSMASPASAKNALTVGASRSDRTQGGWADQTWKQLWPKDYPDLPIAEETTSGDPERLAAFSSRGPCDDQRIKPDLVAPGTNILSTRSSLAPDENFWGVDAQDSNYAFMGGTSMAAPLVSGCAALVREFYQTEHQHEPSAALLKATLINSTRWLQGNDALADHQLMPNYHQGFGCLYMPWAIPNPAEPLLALDFWDRWQQPASSLQATGDRQRLQFAIAGNYPLRICLVWTDVPGRAIQNDLDLFLEHYDQGQKEKWTGNPDARRLMRSPDRENNVEIVRLENPKPGNYLIQVSAHNILRGTQDFALVVTGDLTSPLTPYLGG